jgi:hypothetical protein
MVALVAENGVAISNTSTVMAFNELSGENLGIVGFEALRGVDKPLDQLTLILSFSFDADHHFRVFIGDKLLDEHFPNLARAKATIQKWAANHGYSGVWVAHRERWIFSVNQVGVAEIYQKGE